MEKNNLSIYVHIPFCVKKCEYCDFLSFPFDENMQNEYIDALIKEIKEQGNQLQKNYSKITTIYIGGGTPSVINPDMIKRILQQIYIEFPYLDDNIEISMEANPGTLTKKGLKAYKEAGINRLSIGLQSADNKALKMLGRIHTFEDFLISYEYARDAGFLNINVDLMSSLPGQSVSDYEKGILKILSLNPEHISAYSLIIEEGTKFYKKYNDNPELLPTEDEDRSMYALTKAVLNDYGYKRYEISNYSKPGYECRHNLVYWSRGDYLGVGQGASSLIGNIRLKNTEKYRNYINGLNKDAEKEHLTKEDEMSEFLFLGLRRCSGIFKSEFLDEFGLAVEERYGTVLDKYTKLGLLANDQNRIWLTDLGIDVSNVVFSEFL